MTKQDLINEVAEKTGIDGDKVESVVNAMIKTIRKNVMNGKTVYMRGFATIGPVLRKAKVVRNIKANTSLNLPARYQVKLKPAQEWNDEVAKLEV